MVWIISILVFIVLWVGSIFALAVQDYLMLKKKYSFINCLKGMPKFAYVPIFNTLLFIYIAIANLIYE